MTGTTRSRFFGVYPMLLAYYRADGELDLPAIEAQADVLVRHGAHGCAVMGLGTEVKSSPARSGGKLSTASPSASTGVCHSR